MDYERGSGDDGEQPMTPETPQTDTQADAAEGTVGDAPSSASAGEASADVAPTAQAPAPEVVDAAAVAGEETSAQASDAVESMPDLGTDADVMNDSFESHEAAPPEWPAADFASTTVDAEATDDSSAGAEIAATYAAATAQPTDPGDDSDAPILDEAAAAAPEAYIRADNVTLKQAGAQTIQASTVTVSQGGAGQVHADTVSIEQGGLGMARTKTLTLGDGASAFAVVADEATVEKGSNTFLVVSRTFNGDVQPTIDWRVAAAFGAGLGLAISILRRLR